VHDRYAGRITDVMLQDVTELVFGQPRGGIFQMAYIVEDLGAAIDYWVRDLGVGPWFRLDGFDGGDDAVHRGERYTATVDLAMAFAGHMQIELIQPNDEEPSVYKETIDARGYGFHHFGVASDDVEAGIAELEAKGYALAFKASVPTGGHVAYMDGGPGQPGFLELCAATPAFEELFGSFHRASVNWDGSDPVRPFG
jgi:Glyoxalase/Bleomycin resistance protein/Dioxygenase superfamily